MQPTESAQEEPPRLPHLPVFQAVELVNAATHGIGLVLSIAGAIVMAGSTCHFLTILCFVAAAPAGA